MIETRPRLRGVTINGELLSQLMAARGLQADELAELAGVAEDTVSRARRGQRIERNSLRKLTAALMRVPTDPLMSELVMNKRTAGAQAAAAVERGEASTAAPGEASRGRGEPR